MGVLCKTRMTSIQTKLKCVNKIEKCESTWAEVFFLFSKMKTKAKLAKKNQSVLCLVVLVDAVGSKFKKDHQLKWVAPI